MIPLTVNAGALLHDVAGDEEAVGRGSGLLDRGVVDVGVGVNVQALELAAHGGHGHAVAAVLEGDELLEGNQLYVRGRREGFEGHACDVPFAL